MIRICRTGEKKSGALLGFTNSIIQCIKALQRPHSAFINDTGQSLGFIPKQTYAQGIGFAGLAPLLPMWKVFRNISYAIPAVVMIIIGFMIMFRKKIDPKTVITVQNSLPKIVVTLLLITFSYAIVAILIDIMYLLILLVIGLFGQSGIIQVTPDVINAFLGAKLKDGIDLLFPLGAGSLFGMLIDVVGPGPTIVAGGVSTLAAGVILLGLGITAPIVPFLAVAALVGVGGISLIILFLLAIFLLFVTSAFFSRCWGVTYKSYLDFCWVLYSFSSVPFREITRLEDGYADLSETSWRFP